MKIWQWLAVLAGMAVLCGCGDSEPSNTSTGRKEPAAKPEIKIGVVLPFSGSLLSYGKATYDGIKLRIDQINKAGGVNGRKIKLIEEDNKGDSTETRNVFRKLAASDKVSAVLGPITSTNSLAVRNEAKKLEVPVISPTATNDKVTLRNAYMYRSCFNDSFQGKAVAEYAFKVRKCKTAAIMVDMNSDYSKGLAERFKKAFISLGGKVVTSEGYQQKDTEFGPQLKNVESSKAETLFVPGYPPEVPLIIKQSKVIGYKARLCGADGWDNQAVINGSGNNITNCFLVGAFYRGDSRPVVQNFIRDFKKVYGKEPGTFGALGYDSASMLIEALKTGTTPAKVVEGLCKLNKFDAVTGKITVDKDGNVQKNGVILEVVPDGKKFTTKYLMTINP